MSEEEIRAELTEGMECPGCEAEVKVTLGTASYIRVVHTAECPWLPRYLAGEAYPLGYGGTIPCGVSKVTHRGPYKRPRPDADRGVVLPRRIRSVAQR